MPPYMYWPTINADFDFDEDSAFKNCVSERHIRYVLSLPLWKVRRSRGKASKYDVIYSDGRVIARPTIAVAELPEGYFLEVGFRRDFRQRGEVCYVFHARYL